MKDLNKLRLLAGIQIDSSIEITEKKEQVNEARKVPLRRADLAPRDRKNLEREVAGVKSAIKHIEQAIKALDKIPATDFMGDIPHYITELEELLSTDGGEAGMRKFAAALERNFGDFVQKEKERQRAELEEETHVTEAKDDKADNDYDGDGKVEFSSESTKEDKTKRLKQAMDKNAKHYKAMDKSHREALSGKKEKTNESVHYYKDDYKDFEKDDSKPVNVSDGSANAEQVYDDPMDPKNVKDEGPTQLHTGDERSEQDQSDGHDLEADFKVPPAIKASLKSEIANVKAEADKLDVYNKESAYFYRDMQRAFEDLLDHLEKGTRYDFKQAQHFAQSLMGPMLHKLPADVWKFLANGGETRSLKDYMKKVPDPITGPRNSLK